MGVRGSWICLLGLTRGKVHIPNFGGMSFYEVCSVKVFCHSMHDQSRGSIANYGNCKENSAVLPDRIAP